MDPASAVSLVTGIVTAVPGLITACVELYDHVQTWKRRGPDLDHYFTILKFEQERLKVYEPLLLDLRDRGAHSLLEDILRSMQEVLSNLEALLRKHDERVTNEKKPIAYTLDDITRIGELAAKLTQNHDKLEVLLPDQMKEYARYCLRINVLGKEDLEALHRFSSIDMGKVNRDVIVEAQIRYLTMRMNSGSQLNTGDNKYRYGNEILWLQMPDMSKTPPAWGSTCCLSELDGCERTFGVLKSRKTEHNTSFPPPSRHLLVEWRPSFKRRDQDPASRLNQLTHTLLKMSEAADPSAAESNNPINFRVLRCEGWITPDLNYQRTGLVFSFPKGMGQVPVSLHDRINATQKRNLPDLNLRLDMARALSRSVANLIAIKWLHRAFRSSNVLLFDPQAYKELYVVGHSYTRPNSGVGELSTLLDTDPNMLYRPPRDMTGWWDIRGAPPTTGTEGATGNASNRAYRIDAGFDIFALGIVLLELGYWRTVKSLEQEYKKKNSGREFNQAALLRHADALGFKTGTKYRDVVRKCLKLDFWLLGKVDEEQFMAQVLQDLNACRV